MVDRDGRVDLDALSKGLFLLILGAGTMLRHPPGAPLWIRVLSVVWPLLIIAWGLVKMLRGRQRGYRAGGWTMFAGVWILLLMVGLVSGRLFWPVLLTAIGVAIMWRAIVPVSRQVE